MAKIVFLIFMLGMLCIFHTEVSYSQSFTCPFGTNSSCLEYGDKVCSSRGKCVDRYAKCFSSTTCIGGFVCQSDLEECGDKYNSLVNKYNNLIYKNEALLNKNNNIIDCILSAIDISSAKNCIY